MRKNALCISEVVIPAPERPARIVVLASGSGTLLQALLDDLDRGAAKYEIVAVGADRSACPALDRATKAEIPTFSVLVQDFDERSAWDDALADRCAAFEPDLVVSAGFMKLVGDRFLARFSHRMINTHPSLLPSFPGMYAPRDALNYGAKVTGCTVFVVDGGIDAGPMVAQQAVPVFDADTVQTLHERIKVAERSLLVEVVAAMTSRGWRIRERKVSFP